MKPILRPGCCLVNLSGGCGKKQCRIHRLVLLAFVGPAPEGMVACHNDGGPANNSVENLRWDTQQSNVDDTLRHGTRAAGSRCNSKLTEESVVEIRRPWAEGGVPTKELARLFGVSANNIRAIVRGKSWRHIPQVPDARCVAQETPQHLGNGEEGAAW